MMTRSPRPAPATSADDLVFPTGTGGLCDKDILHTRILSAAVERADQLLHKHEQTPPPQGA
jgi:hypothetical protein